MGYICPSKLQSDTKILPILIALKTLPQRRNERENVSIPTRSIWHPFDPSAFVLICTHHFINDHQSWLLFGGGGMGKGCVFVSNKFLYLYWKTWKITQSARPFQKLHLFWVFFELNFWVLTFFFLLDRTKRTSYEWRVEGLVQHELW